MSFFLGQLAPTVSSDAQLAVAGIEQEDADDSDTSDTDTVSRIV